MQQQQQQQQHLVEFVHHVIGNTGSPSSKQIVAQQSVTADQLLQCLYLLYALSASHTCNAHCAD
jgi:hypothetical protein